MDNAFCGQIFALMSIPIEIDIVISIGTVMKLDKRSISMKLTRLSVGGLLLGFCLMLGSQISHAVTISFTYTDLNTHLLPLGISSPGVGLTETVDLQLTNNTGTDWTDFHFGVGGPLGGNVFFGDLLGTTTGYNGPGTANFGNTRAELDILSLSIPNGSVYTSSVQLVFGEAPVANIAGRPTTDGEPPVIPVPGTLFLVGLGLAGICLRRRSHPWAPHGQAIDK